MITYTAESKPMKLKTDNVVLQDLPTKERHIDLPQGLMGFSELTKLEVLFDEGELPFMHLRSVDGGDVEFIVVEPQGLIKDYIIEVTDQDVAYLSLQKPEDMLILNIVTIGASNNRATVNLVGPIVVNRKTLKGKQIVIGNYQDYSPHYVLYEGDKPDLN